MPILTAVLTIIVAGFLLWLVNALIPMQSTIKTILNVVVAIALVLWLLYGFGIIDGSGEVNMPEIG